MDTNINTEHLEQQDKAVRKNDYSVQRAPTDLSCHTAPAFQVIANTAFF